MTGMRRLPLGPIEAFAVVARCGSLAEAALRMNLTVPALSRRIRLLEADLGVTLFRRLPRGLDLTEAGSAYLAALAPAWDAVGAATEAARIQGRRRALRISVMPTFAANWLVPRLGRFQALHRAVDVELSTDAEVVDLQARPDLDGAIRLGCGPWPGQASVPFLPVLAVPVASPGFLAGRPLPRRARDLLGLPLIGTAHQPAFWREWFVAAGAGEAEGGCRSFDNLQVVYEAAAAGMGVALGLTPVVRPYLESGRLVQLFADPLPLPRQFHLVRRRSAAAGANRRLGQFHRWLQAEAMRDSSLASS